MESLTVKLKDNGEETQKFQLETTGNRIGKHQQITENKNTNLLIQRPSMIIFKRYVDNLMCENDGLEKDMPSKG